MRVLFMGSGAFSCPSVRVLLKSEKHELVGVVTQPDKPVGRNRSIKPCPVRTMLGDDSPVPVMVPENVNEPLFVETVSRINPDIVVVAAYGQILKKRILNIPKYGFINVHASILPSYRGAAPIQWAVINGEVRTGVTIMQVNEKMDAGDIILTIDERIERSDTAGTLHDRLADDGAHLLVEALEVIESGQAVRIPQDESQATYAPKLTKEDGKIDWTQTSEKIYHRVRGMNPWPVCWCKYAEKVLRVFEVEVEDRSGGVGTVLDISGAGPLVGAGEGSVRLIRVQPQDGRIMDGSAYVCGRVVKVGDRML